VAPCVWNWRAGVARRGLGLLTSVCGAEVTAAAGVVVAAVRWCCGLPAVGCGAAG
jgi:hypothetical protein